VPVGSQDRVPPAESFIPIYPDSLHDLSSPVNQIATAFELYLTRQRQLSGGQPDDALLSLVQTSMLRLQQLMAAMREYTRLTGSMMEMRTCDGNKLLESALASLAPVIQESGAQVISDAFPTLQCDPGRITYVLIHLIGNAIKFRGGEPPEIRAGAVSQGANWVFSIRDNGIGIDARHHEAVFHIFKRFNGDRYPGGGAGLAISRQIIEQHGGRIWLESELGRGSTFYFTLPAG